MDTSNINDQDNKANLSNDQNSKSNLSNDQNSKSNLSNDQNSKSNLSNDQNSKANLSDVYVPRMLPLKVVTYHTGLSSTTIYDMLDKKSKRYDPTFPIQVKLSKGRVAWVESEVTKWLDDKIAARFQ